MIAALTKTKTKSPSIDRSSRRGPPGTVEPNPCADSAPISPASPMMSLGATRPLWPDTGVWMPTERLAMGHDMVRLKSGGGRRPRDCAERHCRPDPRCRRAHQGVCRAGAAGEGRMIEIDGLEVRFGGVRALNALTASLDSSVTGL